MFRGVSVANEQFRRDAAAVRAGAAEGAAFYKRDVHSGGTAFDGGGNRVSAAKDNEIDRSDIGALQANRGHDSAELCGQE